MLYCESGKPLKGSLRSLVIYVYQGSRNLHQDLLKPPILVLYLNLLALLLLRVNALSWKLLVAGLTDWQNEAHRRIFAPRLQSIQASHSASAPQLAQGDPRAMVRRYCPNNSRLRRFQCMAKRKGRRRKEKLPSTQTL